MVAFADEFGLWVDEANKATYPGLYGQGDGSTTMTLPDWRGVVSRHLDEGKGLDDVNRALGSYQEDIMAGHTHSFNYYINVGLIVGSPDRVTGVGHSGSVTTQTTTSAGGAETRMKNISVLAVMRY